MEDEVVLSFGKEEEEVFNCNGETGLEHFECKICQEYDEPLSLEVPCACSGSLKFAHRKCVQRWCNEKGNTTCEICNQPYMSGYTSSQQIQVDESSIDIRGSSGISEAITDFNGSHHSHILTIAAIEQHILEEDFGGYIDPSTSCAPSCQSTTFILVVLFVLHNLLTITISMQVNAPTLLCILLMRIVEVIMIVYVLVREVKIAQNSIQSHLRAST